jgi:hypothetical protein
VLSTHHARLRVQRAPGFPCALCFFKAKDFAKLGRIASREGEGMSQLTTPAEPGVATLIEVPHRD